MCLCARARRGWHSGLGACLAWARTGSPKLSLHPSTHQLPASVKVCRRGCGTVLYQGVQGVSGEVSDQGQGRGSAVQQALVSLALEVAGMAGPRDRRPEVRGQGSRAAAAPVSSCFPPPGPLPLPLPSFAVLRSRVWLQLAWLLVPASLLCVTLGQGLRSGPQFPTHHPVTRASSQPQWCSAVTGHKGAYRCC